MSDEDEGMLGEDDSTPLFVKTILVREVRKFAGYLQKGDKLFITDGSGQHKSFLGFIDLLKDVVGYKRAADMLVTLMMADDSYLDIFVFPAIYLYRHCIELSLKEIIRKGNAVLGKPAIGELGYPKIHLLKDLWKDCKVILRHPYVGLTDQQTLDQIEIMEELIMELHAVDPQSMTFRYSSNPLPAYWGYWVDVEHVKEIMGKMDDFFTYISAHLEQGESEF